jgi:Uma2 family endonuclease
MTQQISLQISANEDEIITELDISHLVIEDDVPVDNFQSELQQRLLVEPLYSAEALPAPFLAAANVGLFYKLKGEPIVPDMMLSLGVQRAADFSQRQNRSYFVWEFGKVPDLAIEVVSNQEGNELSLSRKAQQEGKTCKKTIYAQIGVPYYVVFDPLQQIQAEMDDALLRIWTISPLGYSELGSGLTETGQFIWLERIGLGLALWEGPFEEEIPRLWLRWCDQTGQVIPTGAEGQAQARQQAEAERQRADLEQQRAETERQRAEAERQRADLEQQRAETERQRAEAECQRAEQLAARLRALGLDPEADL